MKNKAENGTEIKCLIDHENNTEQSKNKFNSNEILQNETLIKKMFQQRQKQTEVNFSGGPTKYGLNQPDSKDCLEFSQELYLDKDKTKIKRIVKNFRMKSENVSSEENLEDMLRPYFRPKRDIYNISAENPLFRAINPFQGMEEGFVNNPSTLNHPEEIKRWMQEVLPAASKEENKTACHIRASKAHQAALKRNVTKPYAYYYKEAQLDDIVERVGNKFYERQKMTTTQEPKLTKSHKQMRDELIEKMGTKITIQTLSASSQEMPSYLEREFKERYPQHVNEDGQSVDDNDFLFGSVRSGERKRRDVSDKLKEKLLKGNAIFKSRLEKILPRYENGAKNNNTKESIKSDINTKCNSTLKAEIAQHPLYKKFQSFTINYDESPPEQWETDQTTLFSLGNSFEEIINSHQEGDFKHLVGLKRDKVQDYITLYNTSVSFRNNSDCTKHRVHFNCFLSDSSRLLKEKEKLLFTNDPEDNKNMTVPIFITKEKTFWTRPTFKNVLRTHFIQKNENLLDNSEDFDEKHLPLNSEEAMLLKNENSTQNGEEYESRDKKEQNKQYDLKSKLESDLEFRDGLFGLKNSDVEFFAKNKNAANMVRTTEIIIKRFAKLNSTWGSKVKTEVFRMQGDSDMEEYRLDRSITSQPTENNKLKKNLQSQRHDHSQGRDLVNNEIKKRRRKRFAVQKQMEFKVLNRKMRSIGLKAKRNLSLEILQKEAKFKKPDFLKEWDVKDELFYKTGHSKNKMIVDDGTGDMQRLIREQCKEPSRESDIIEGSETEFRKFKEIPDYGAKSMPSHLEEDDWDTNVTNTEGTLFHEFFQDINKSSEITLDSNIYDCNFEDPTQRFRRRLERLEKFVGCRLKTPGPEYFTMPPTVSAWTTNKNQNGGPSKSIETPDISYKPVISTGKNLQYALDRKIPADNSLNTTWITADSADIIEGNKEDFERFINHNFDSENDTPWTQFDVEGMEKFIGKTLPNRNSSIVYKLYRH